MYSLSRCCSLAATILLTCISALAQSPATSPGAASAAEPVSGVADLLPELQVVRFRQNPSAPATYQLIDAEVARLFPEAVRPGANPRQLDYDQLTVLLFGVAKDLRESNLHLAEQVEHLLSEKADLERKLHELDMRLVQLTNTVNAQTEQQRGRESRTTSTRQ